MQLRQYQLDAKNSIYNYFMKGGNGNPLVAMPTGTGKSLVIADFIREIMKQWPKQRIIVMTHVKELLVQNSEKLHILWPNAPYGIYSAGLNRKENVYPITFAGIASIVKNIGDFGHIDLLLIDEAHLLSPKADTMYGVAISKLREVNPALKVIGFTATPYRTGQGLLTNQGGIFTDICFDITGLHEFNKLIIEGWITTLIPKRTETELHTENVGISNGDFNKAELEHAVDKNSLNYQVCKEMIEAAQDRKKWLIFAAGVKHSIHIADMLKTFGISAVAVHSKIGDAERDKTIENFKTGTLRCIVNNNVLTTGFDCPSIDFIGMLRPTMSCGLWVQMLGRGTRPYPGRQYQTIGADK
jgi:DNA repair protein RadD